MIDDDQVCEHGTAMDVHCCGCHSGFLFSPDQCTCLNPDGPDEREAVEVTPRRRDRYIGRRAGGSFFYDHRRIAAEALGRPLPPGVVVHHQTDTQLAILPDQRYHMQLERRLRVLRAGGDPWADAYCSVGQHVAPIGEFWRRKSASLSQVVGALTTECRSCKTERRRRARAS